MEYGEFEIEFKNIGKFKSFEDAVKDDTEVRIHHNFLTEVQNLHLRLYDFDKFHQSTGKVFTRYQFNSNFLIEDLNIANILKEQANIDFEGYQSELKIVDIYRRRKRWSDDDNSFLNFNLVVYDNNRNFAFADTQISPENKNEIYLVRFRLKDDKSIPLHERLSKFKLVKLPNPPKRRYS
jgi:hypothetical protein